MKQTILLLSCEHAVDTVPAPFKHLFPNPLPRLQARKSFDPGALHITKAINAELKCEFTQSSASRLLVDCNRGSSRGQCFSRYTKSLAHADKQNLLDTYYTPFHEQTQSMIERHIKNNQQVLHISVHTFLPFFKGFRRNAGIGLLYHSKRHAEKEVARIWHGLLLQETPSYRIRYNYPFPGNSDSFVKKLRTVYSEGDYLGLELEINQALLCTPQALQDMACVISHSLGELITLL